jgi:biopolymer transport protein ExbB
LFSLLLLAVSPAGCINADYSGTEFMCNLEEPCPSGFNCIGGRCVRPTADDGGPTIDADPNAPDADPNAPDADTSNWWNTSWSYRRDITLDNTAQSEALAAIPVLVVLPTSFDYANAAAGGADIRFTDAGGSTELTYHIERWSPGSESYLWVRVPAIAAGATELIWMYYGNSSAPDVQNAAGTYDVNFSAVWHLNETSGAHIDSAGGVSCTWLGVGGTQDAVGAIAGANDFDGNQNAADCGQSTIPDSTDHTITVWVNLPGTGDANQEVFAAEGLSSPFRGQAIYVRRSDGAIGKWWGSGYVYAANAANRIAANTWELIAIRGTKSTNSGFVEVSRNGENWESIVTGNTNNLAIQSGTPIIIGKWTGAGNAATRGRIDEVQVSSVRRSDSWIRAQFLMVQGNFATVGAAQMQGN